MVKASHVFSLRALVCIGRHSRDIQKGASLFNIFIYSCAAQDENVKNNID